MQYDNVINTTEQVNDIQNGIRQIFLESYFLEPIKLYQKGMFFMSNYMNRYGFRAWPLYE